MARQVSMVFWRDVCVLSACLEYSWVPEGKRHVIQLGPNQSEDSTTDSITIPDDISYVEVYRLMSNGVGTDSWQFPPGQPHTSPVIYSAIEVFEERMEVVGTAHYADGSHVSGTRMLNRSPLLCPELPQDGAG
jgi:hypothetical protein